MLTITLDSTQIKTYLECPRKWAFQYCENLHYYAEKRKALDKGSFVHKLLEVFYTLRALQPKEDRFAHYMVVKDLFKGQLAEGLTENEQEFIFQRFMQYVIKWTAYDFVPSIRGGQVGVELGFSNVLKSTADTTFIIEGKIDLLTTLPDGTPAFADNKTQDQLGYLYKYKPQFLIYSWATGFRKGVINYFRLSQKYDEKTTFERIYFDVPEEKLTAFMEKVEKIFQEIKVVILAQGTSQEKLVGQMFPENFNSCSGAWEKAPCHFCKICDEPERMQEQIKSFNYFKGKKWSPWETTDNQR